MTDKLTDKLSSEQRDWSISKKARDRILCELSFAVRQFQERNVREYMVKKIEEDMEDFLNANTAEDECMHGADCPICTGDWSEFILETDNQIALRKFPVILDALLEYRNPKTLRQYRELPELVDEKFNEWCIGYLQQEE